MIKVVPLLVLTLLTLSGCTTTQETSMTESPAIPVNDFPTRDRVEYALGCIEKEGGLTYQTLYSCTCSIDKIAEKMPYKEYTEAKTFTFMRSTPGEKGGVFRDPPEAAKLRKKLQEAEAYAEKSCFVRPKPKPE